MINQSEIIYSGHPEPAATEQDAVSIEKTRRELIEKEEDDRMFNKSFDEIAANAEKDQDHLDLIDQEFMASQRSVKKV